MWVKRASNNKDHVLFSQTYSSPSSCDSYWINSVNNAQFDYVGGAFRQSTSSVYRDPSAWYHFLWVQETHKAADSDRLRLYVNGALQPFSGGTPVRLNYDGAIPGAGVTFFIGCFYTSGSSTLYFLDGYLADLHFIDGLALPPTTFGQFDDNGVWVPKKPTGLTYGTNGFHLDFSDSANIGKDRSGNNNNFTPTGFQLTNPAAADYDLMKDSPTSNYATLNPLYPGSSTSNANLTSANNTAKPTIIGTATAVEVAGASQNWNGTEAGWTYSGNIEFGQMDFATPLAASNLPYVPVPNTITGTFTGNSSADGPFVYTGCIPGRIQYGTVDVTYGNRFANNDVDFLCNGFKVRSGTSNAGAVNYTVTTTHSDGEYSGRKVPFGGFNVSPATACSN
jgi:hypothetical protein